MCVWRLGRGGGGGEGGGEDGSLCVLIYLCLYFSFIVVYFFSIND